MPAAPARPLFHRLARGLLGAALAGLALSATAATRSGGKGWETYLTGNAADAAPAAPPTRPSAVLMGGGTDVDAAFAWMIQRAGGGDFVVLRASGADGYNDYLYAMGGLDSVETLVVKTRDAAHDPAVVARIDRAEAVFLAGGDQADYVTLWQGTPLAAALDRALARHAPVGGTSAGLAVLGQFDFAALNGTVDSAEVLANPYHKRVTLDERLLTLPGLAGTVTDSHFGERDRMGRLLGFVARLLQDGRVAVDAARAIGIDAATAVLLDDGVGSVVGSGAAWFLRPTIAPTVCAPRTPLTLRNVGVDRVPAGSSFDLLRWQGHGATVHYGLSAETGVLTSSQPGGAVY